ncbi:MAG: hypothetical protein IJX95_05485 [Lachnospiraceae bacterium]|nr:hypothetical protein [Lachnospiraceae bacterium]
MKDKVERLAKGIFEYEQPAVVISEEMISAEVPAGETFCGKFSVRNRDMRVMKGVLYSSDEVLELKERQFIGADNEISYTVHGEYAAPGEVHKGTITIVSEFGEVLLPFTVKIVPVACNSSEGEIRDLFQFAGLAQSDWFEAKRLFAEESFAKTVLGDREEETTVYRLLRKCRSVDRALEEFLVYTKKKSRIQIKADRTVLQFRPGDKALMDRITVSRDTWGHTDVIVETEGDFFLVSSHRLLSESFNGNTCALEVAVDGAALAEGNYFGKIYLKTPRQCIKIEVICVCERTAREEMRKRRAFHEIEIRLFQRYFDFRLGKVKAGSYIAETESMVDLLLLRLQENIFDNGVRRRKELLYQMYRAYIALMSKKEKYAESEIIRLKSLLEQEPADGELTGALYYLEAMYQKDADAVKVYSSRIKQLSEHYKESGLLLWFRLYTDKRSENGRAVMLDELEERFQRGNRSPLLYFEAAMLWNEDPSLLRKTGPFELQALLFGLKNNMLQRETVLQFSILASQCSAAQDSLLVRCLCLAYKQYNLRDTLQALCTFLISNEIREKKYHPYFADACAMQLRIPMLQEYYIYTGDFGFQTKIDQSVLMYFIYGNELEESYCAFLYAYIIRNQDTLSSFYRTYLKRMEQYAVNSIKNGKIDKNLATVYGEVLRSSLLDSELAAALPKLIFSYYIECDNPQMTAVAVLHKEEETERIVPFVDGAATVCMYTEDAKLVLVDAEGNRYLPAGDCRVSRLLHEEDLLYRCYELAGENRILLLNFLEKVHNYRMAEVDSVELSKRVVHVDGLLEEFRQKEIHFLIRYCYDNFQGELMDGYLSKLNLDFLNKEERNRMIELLIVRGRYDLALDALTKYGMKGVETKCLLRLCERMLLQCDGEQNDMLLLLCRQVFFEGKPDEKVVQYLEQYFYGTTEEMYQVWRRAAELELKTELLEERLLGQILFAGSYVPEAYQVFLSYRKKKTNPKLVRAYLSQTAYRCFLLGCELPEELAEQMKEEAEEDNEICTLALLKNYSEKEELTDAEAGFAETGMRKFAEKGMIFSFFSEFEGRVPLPPCMADKLYVEYHTHPESRVTISYLFDNEGDERFVKEEMRHIGYGVFVKEFILFYEETLQYYITEERNGESQITESFYRSLDSVKVHDETTKYGQINLILTAQDMKDEKTTIDMLESYYRMEYTINRLFEPIKE